MERDLSTEKQTGFELTRVSASVKGPMGGATFFNIAQPNEKLFTPGAAHWATEHTARV